MINPRIQVLTLQIAAICLGINAAGRYTACCDIDGDNRGLYVTLSERTTREARAEMTQEERIARWFFSETVYLDRFTGSLNPGAAEAGEVCDELEALLTQLLAYHPSACGVAA
jgi:hypothetical protein